MNRHFCEKLFSTIFITLAIIMFGILFYYSLGITAVQSDNIWEEHLYIEYDSIIANVIMLIIALLAFGLVGKLSLKLQSMKSRNILLGIVCILVGVISVYWVYACKAQPTADQEMIYQYADAFNMGDFGGLKKGHYVARYSHQLGMITLLRGIFTIFGESNYQAFQYFSACLNPLLVFSGCKIVRILSNNNAKAELFYLILSVFCFPMYAYTTYVYGDMISTVFVMFGVWMFLCCLKKISPIRLVLFALSIGIAVQLRKNTLILVIALVIVMLVKLLAEFNKKNIIIMISLVVGVLVFKIFVEGLYWNVRDEDAQAIPASLFVVMGLNDDNQHAGWHNSYNYFTFAACYDDVKLANEKAIADLEMYKNIYKNDPEYMMDFFSRKMILQWNAPMYQSLVMTAYTEEERLFPAKQIYEYGRSTRLIECGTKVYQMLLYGSILYLLVFSKKDFERIEKCTLLIAVFGGFLFSLMWEAKTRYVLPYLFMMLPYMSIGIMELTKRIEEKLFHKIHEKDKENKIQ